MVQKSALVLRQSTETQSWLLSRQRFIDPGGLGESKATTSSTRDQKGFFPRNTKWEARNFQQDILKIYDRIKQHAFSIDDIWLKRPNESKDFKRLRKNKKKIIHLYLYIAIFIRIGVCVHTRTQVARRRESVALFMCEFVTLYACSGKDLSSCYVEGAPIAHRPAQDTRVDNQDKSCDRRLL